MGWMKQVFEDFVTVITAGFLNDLQDQLITDEQNIEKKVEKVTGKGLSSNDYTDEEKAKLTALPAKSALDSSLAQKVDKRTGATEEVYTHTGATQAGREVSATPKVDAIPVYSSDGRLKANAPSASNDVIRKYEHDKLISDLKAGTEATADLHLGFYLDANGDLCQVDDE